MKKRILIVRIDRIGDVTLTTSLPREIKRQFPDAFIAVLVKEYTKDIYINNPYVDEILTADNMLACSKLEVFKHAAFLRKYNFTHSFLILPNEKINYILFLAGIKNRYGTGYKFYQAITGVKGISRNKYIPLRHEADYCMDFVRALGVETNNIFPELFLSESEKEEVAKAKNEILLQGNKKYIVGIHMSSGNSAPNLPNIYYKELIEKLKQNLSYQIVVTDNTIDESVKNIDGILYPNIGQSLRSSILNFAKLDLLVSASTGPLHLCAGLGIQTFSVFCPLTACSPKLWGPLGNNGVVVIPTEQYCKNECPNDPKLCKYKNIENYMLEELINKISYYYK